MPRPVKNRRICALPRYRLFVSRQGDTAQQVTLAVEEYETIRLIDLLGCTQEECARQMAVSRTTVQGIYNKARHKLADALVNGYAIAIEGGMYEVCQNEEGCACSRCNDKGCGRRRGVCGKAQQRHFSGSCSQSITRGNLHDA